MSLPSRHMDLIIRPPRVRPEPLDSLLQRTAHSVRVSGSRATCWKCSSGYSKKDPAIRDWLQSPCILHSVAASVYDRPVNLQADAPVHIGNQSIHHTHQMRQHKGFMYCKRCGSRAGTKIRYLSKQCLPPSSYGQATIRAIQRDRLPPNLTDWPMNRYGQYFSNAFYHRLTRA